MKKFALALLMIFGAMSLQSNRAAANGATVVFLQVRLQDYFLTAAIRDKQFNTSPLFDVLESSADSLYVARLDPYIYRWASYYAAQGNDVALEFDGYESVTFRYYPSVRAILGVGENNEIIVLLPEVTTQPVVQKPRVNDEVVTPVNEDEPCDKD